MRLLGPENLERLKQQYNEIEETRQAILDKEKERGELQALEENLREEYLKIYNKNEEYKEEIFDVKKRILKVQKKSEYTQLQIDEIIEVLNPEAAEDGEKREKQVIKPGINPILLKKLKEEKRRREKQLLRQRLAQAVDFLDEDDVNISELKEKSFFAFYWVKLIDFYQ